MRRSRFPAHVTAPLLALACALPASNPAAAQAAAVPDSVDQWVEAYLAQSHVPGAAIAIVDHGRLVKARGYGLASVELDVPVTPQTVFQSGSVGKQFTAAEILILRQDGRLSLDDPVTKYLPELPGDWSDITIRHLLNHTSGLGDFPPPDAAIRRDYTEAEMLAMLTGQPRHFAAGDDWLYSNADYVLLGFVIERITGAHWSRFLRERVFEPLGMKTARLISEADIVPNRAAGYQLVNGELKNQVWVAPQWNTTADGALYLTVLDLAKWDAALEGTQILSEESKRLMWAPARLNDGSTVRYGFGWELMEDPPGVAHGGSWQGFKSYIARFTRDRVTVIALSNCACADPVLLAHMPAALHRPSLRLPDPPSISLPAAALREYAGVYRLADGDSAVVSSTATDLEVRLPPLGDVRVRPTGPDAFYLEEQPIPVHFLRDPATGRVRWLRVGYPGPLLRGTRTGPARGPATSRPETSERGAATG